MIDAGWIGRAPVLILRAELDALGTGGVLFERELLADMQRPHADGLIVEARLAPGYARAFDAYRVRPVNRGVPSITTLP